MRRLGENPPRILAFGPFSLFPDQGRLLEGDVPVRIGSRALDILTALVERAGQVVSKEELIERAWPNTLVVEANLRVHVAGLRKLLGDGHGGANYIAGVVGRGYRFVAPVMLRSAAELPPAPLPATGQSVDLPGRLTRMVGRAEIVGKLSTRLPQSRFITIVGTGGIGKTSVAIAVAEKLGTSYQSGARFIDLTPVTNPLAIPSVLSSAFGISKQTMDTVPNLIAFLRDKHMLLVLDNCEHVVNAAAVLTEQILKAAPHVHILATSREPLYAEGEVVQRLEPLALPPRGSKITGPAALAFSAVQLFIDRLSANVDGFQITDEDASIISEICCALDGLPLAIELAASRADAFGIRGLAALLNDRFKLHMPGRRTAPARHQTLGTMLDWSYDQLADPERAALRRLAVFPSRFTLESASAVLSISGFAASDVINLLASLVTKSLVVADIGDAIPKYRLHSTTRAYALQKLTDSGELEQISRRHAEHCRHSVEVAGDELACKPAGEWLVSHGELIDDVRAALIWAFSPAGDADLGIALTVTSIPFWTLLSLNEECRMNVESALSCLETIGSQGIQDKLRLLAALGGALWYTRGSVPEMTSTWQSVLVAAEEIQNIEYQLRSLLGLWSDKINRGENRASLAVAERFERIAVNSDDSADSLVADRMIGYSLYLLGELTPARTRIERVLSGYVVPGNRSHIVRFQFDQRILARVALANVLWLQGFPDQAMCVAEANIEEAIEIDHALSLIYVFAKSACPLALLVGDLEKAQSLVTALLEHPGRQFSAPWDRWGRCFEGVLLLKRGNVAQGVRVLGSMLSDFPENAFHMHYIAFLGELAEGLARAGEIAAAVSTIDQALNASRRCEENWCVAELLRIKGEIVLRGSGAEASAEAQACFQDALDWARRQGALSWELRAATSLARSLQWQGQTSEARQILSMTYDRFTEGFSTSDLANARTLLSHLE